MKVHENPIAHIVVAQQQARPRDGEPVSGGIPPAAERGPQHLHSTSSSSPRTGEQPTGLLGQAGRDASWTLHR